MFEFAISGKGRDHKRHQDDDRRQGEEFNNEEWYKQEMRHRVGVNA
jgi:hypothetical protein